MAVEIDVVGIAGDNLTKLTLVDNGVNSLKAAIAQECSVPIEYQSLLQGSKRLASSDKFETGTLPITLVKRIEGSFMTMDGDGRWCASANGEFIVTVGPSEYMLQKKAGDAVIYTYFEDDRQCMMFVVATRPDEEIDFVPDCVVVIEHQGAVECFIAGPGGKLVKREASIEQ
eukprot:TRINITY_DN79191_c0_g1_i1.p1 TRINITY_DN79191_c0_g1~~TRINITY_DN79191_c0_g1_i1.p1  ORF type:complete len:172 (+),score=30.25 TRINITY_DN79191_c0_g1_i1:90-605(+)